MIIYILPSFFQSQWRVVLWFGNTQINSRFGEIVVILCISLHAVQTVFVYLLLMLMQCNLCGKRRINLCFLRIWFSSRLFWRDLYYLISVLDQPKACVNACPCSNPSLTVEKAAIHWIERSEYSIFPLAFLFKM